MKKYFLPAVFLFLLALAVFSPAFAADVKETEGELGNIELLLELGILVFVGGILYNLWGTISAFGGLIGNALKIVGVGVFLFSFEAIDKVLEHFHLDYIEKTLSPSGEEIFHDVLKLVGLFFLAWGLMKLSKIAKNPGAN